MTPVCKSRANTSEANTAHSGACWEARRYQSHPTKSGGGKGIVRFMTNSFERLLLRLIYYVGEDILTDEAEDRIITIEERWQSSGKVRGVDLLWMQETLRELEEG